MANQPTVFNLFWSTRLIGKGPLPVPVTRHSVSTLSQQRTIDAVILYPALATPEIIAADDDQLELLLLTKASYTIPLLRDYIRLQLKVCSGFDYKRPCANRALFVDASGNEVGTPSERTIDIESKPFSPKDKLSTKSGRFTGYVEEHAYDVFKKAGYDKLYSISMSNKCLAPALDHTVNSAPEPQDSLIDGILDKYKPVEKYNDGRYHSFEIRNGDVDCTTFDAHCPIQAWHPVFQYAQNGLQYANIFHHSDIHLAARQQILAKSRARVIDYSAGGAEADSDRSPNIGAMVNICSKDMLDILSKFGASGADMLLVGGDLMDFLRSCRLSASIARDVQGGKPTKVWSAVALDDDYAKRYTDGVDLIVFYGTLVRFYSSNSKPAFLVTGNHDCYWLPFGISPRIAGVRANQGIPADHNLTFYEAILAFGETFRELKSPLPNSPFNKDRLDWFYGVFTPFADYSVELPKQILVALGWGNDESMIDFPPKGHGVTHLPRATQVVSDNQLSLLSAAVAKRPKNVILMTHFTFVSYADDLPTSEGESKQGDVYFDIFKGYSEHNMGTFEINRKPLFEKHCGKDRDIQVILTGHSHRRALYLIYRIDYSGRNSVKTLHFDFDNLSYAQTKYAGQIKPAVILSDSGGTIPRLNLQKFSGENEFRAWGSDSPSGTSLQFDQTTGAVSSLRAVRTSCCKPRFVVALDYMDVYEKKDVITEFQSAEFSISDEQNDALKELVFDVKLRNDSLPPGLSIEEITLYQKYGSSNWLRVLMQKRGSSSFAIATHGEVRMFVWCMATYKERCNFMAIKFGLPSGYARYDFKDPWCFEFQVDFETSGRGVFHWSPTRKKYKILRDKDRAEIPDFEYRRKCIPEKYDEPKVQQFKGK